MKKRALALLLAVLPTLFFIGITEPTLAQQNALKFDGSNDYVTFGVAPELASQNFTVEIWFKKTGTGDDNTTGGGGIDLLPLIAKGSPETDNSVTGTNKDANYILGIKVPEMVIAADFEEGFGSASQSLNHPLWGTTTILDEVWYHAAVTFSSTGDYKLYLNGNLEASESLGGSVYPQGASIQPAVLGVMMRTTGATNGFFEGELDEARIWDHARSQSEIEDNMGDEVTSGAGLLGRWGLNDGSGTLAANSVTGSPDGTLTNGPSWVTGLPFPFSMITFQEGVDGYSGTVDTHIHDGQIENYGGYPYIKWDLSGGTPSGIMHALLRFEDIFGSGSDQVPTGASIHTATMVYNVENSGDVADVHDVLVDWDESANYTNFGGDAGVQVDEFNPDKVDDAYGNPTGIYSIICTSSLSSWSADPASNKGWIFNPTDGDGVNVSSSESSSENLRPLLQVFYGEVVTDPPAAPGDLSATETASLQIDLTWTDNSDNETGFEIEYYTTGSVGTFSYLATVGINSTAYSHDGLDPEKEYCYRVRAVNGAGNSDYSNTDCATTPIQPPTAIDFGGSDAYVYFGDPDELDLTAFTLECWFRRDGTGDIVSTGGGGVTNAVPIITKGRGEGDGSNVDMNYFFGIDNSTGTLFGDFEEGIGGTGPVGQNHPILGVQVISMGVWYHGAVTYDGSIWRLYVNGIQDNYLDVGEPVRWNSIQHAALASALQSGGIGSEDGRFDGVIDEARIWNYARTQSEILSTINDELSSGTGLVARWGLNEGTGTDVGSPIIPAVNGTIQGSNWSWVTPGAPFNAVNSIPVAPSSLLASSTSGLEIDLSWTDNSDNESGFEIEFSTDGSGGTYTFLINLGANTTTFSHTALIPIQEYCYRIRAVNGIGPSTFSNSSCATTPLEPNNALDFDGTNDFVSMGAANGTLGTLINTPTWNTETGINPTPIGNHSLQFNGSSDYITFGQAMELSTQNFTVEVWFKRTGAGISNTTGNLGITDFIPLLAKGAPEADADINDGNYLIGLQASTNVLCADFEEGTGSATPGLNHPLYGTTTILNDVWYHAAATFANGVYTLYLNGEVENSTTFTGIWPQGGSTQYAALATMLKSDGTNNSPSGGYFAGVLDEARIWNYARTQAEIQSTMNQELSNANGLIGRWGLNEGYGTTIEGSINSLGLSSFTIETWFNWTGGGETTSTGGGGLGTVIPLVTKGMAQSDGSNLDMNYFLGIQGGKLAADFEDIDADAIDGDKAGQNHPIIGDLTVTPNVWHHAAVSYDGSTWALYLDGELDKELDITTSGFYSPRPQFASIQHACIGTARGSGGTIPSGQPEGNFQGSIDEVRIWNYPRSLNEIRENMHRKLGSPESESNLVAYYQCNSSLGISLLNQLANNLHGTLYNMENADWVASTAPIPYYSIANGNCNDNATWELGQNAPDRAWARTKVKNDVIVCSMVEAIDFTIEATGSVSINPDMGLTVSGELINNAGTDGLVIEADASGMGSLIHNSGNVEGRAELFITSDQWHYVSSPLNDIHESGVFEGFYLKPYDEPANAWGASITALDADLITMKGYEAWIYNEFNPVTLYFNGILNEGYQSIAVTNSGGPDSPGYNLVGNPYPSALDWKGSGWTKDNIDDAIYFWEGVGGDDGTGNYHSFVDDVATGDASQYIPSMQAFFIHASDDGLLAVNNEARVHNEQVYFKAEEVTESPILRISVHTDVNHTDETIIRFVPQATIEHDAAFDAFKLYGHNFPQVFSSTENGEELAINTLPEYTNETIVPLGFIAPEYDEYTLEMTEFSGFDEPTNIFLEDKITGNVQELTENPMYTFQASPEDENDRFALHFAEVNGIKKLMPDGANIFAAGQTLIVQNLLPEKGVVTVFNTIGKKIRTENIESGKLLRMQMYDATGIYIVEFRTDNSMLTKKVYLK